GKREVDAAACPLAHRFHPRLVAELDQQATLTRWHGAILVELGGIGQARGHLAPLSSGLAVLVIRAGVAARELLEAALRGWRGLRFEHPTRSLDELRGARRGLGARGKPARIPVAHLARQGARLRLQFVGGEEIAEVA